jgi:hypothetical protein
MVASITRIQSPPESGFVIHSSRIWNAITFRPENARNIFEVWDHVKKRRKREATVWRHSNMYRTSYEQCATALKNVFTYSLFSRGFLPGKIHVRFIDDRRFRMRVVYSGTRAWENMSRLFRDLGEFIDALTYLHHHDHHDHHLQGLSLLACSALIHEESWRIRINNFFVDY